MLKMRKILLRIKPYKSVYSDGYWLLKEALEEHERIHTCVGNGHIDEFAVAAVNEKMTHTLREVIDASEQCAEMTKRMCEYHYDGLKGIQDAIKKLNEQQILAGFVSEVDKAFLDEHVMSVGRFAKKLIKQLLPLAKAGAKDNKERTTVFLSRKFVEK